ncbi:MAG TPA: 2-oxoglutarate dehydrogenase complex dihydrolipoyllysine-residue succinyltransferase, partial [Candidatus Dormibacteraeota bacterium]|nr:2-oxoglutarate dehydrogenase complex dihydrolipoyllysine-residue succinyltransferase [Candidatus Dormibacteraeota bacterium]
VAPAAAPAKAPTPRPAAPAKPAAAADGDGAREAAKLSPSVRRLVEENHLDPGSIAGSGRDGRLTKSDVVGYLGKKPTEAPAVVAAAQAPMARTPAARSVAGARAEQRVPMTRLRARIAQRLVEAQSTQALLTTFNEVDLSAAQELRARYKERFEKEHGVKLGFMSFFVKAAIEALKRFPVLNASVDANDIIYHEYYDIGVAVSTDRGLIVPIVRDADTKSFAQIEKEVADYARRAREGSLAIEELTGGTFTITNGGVFGSLMSTPIVNAPQSAILGMHKIQERPMVLGGQVLPRPMMYLAVTYDHRIIDGREAVQFLVAIKDALEDPGRMLLGV